jgi:glutamate--cysteine ligase
MMLAEQHRRYFAERPLSAEAQALFNQQAASSHQQQQDLEREQQLPFEAYLANYYAQYRNCRCGQADELSATAE